MILLILVDPILSSSGLSNLNSIMILLIRAVVPSRLDSSYAFKFHYDSINSEEDEDFEVCTTRI